MPISTPAKISLPLDIPQVDVLATKQTREGKYLITVESRRETTKCGVCQQEITCNWDKVENLNTIGIDEVAQKKGHKGYRAVVTARQGDGTVLILAVLTDRKKRR